MTKPGKNSGLRKRHSNECTSKGWNVTGAKGIRRGEGSRYSKQGKANDDDDDDDDTTTVIPISWVRPGNVFVPSLS